MSSQRRRLSVAMTTYNGQAYVLDQLRSIYDQTRQVDEVVICDDGSVDSTIELVNSFINTRRLSTWRIIVNEKRLGFGDNFWKAISLCTGDLVLLSDQDDVWYPNKAAEMESVMLRENAVLLASSYDVCNEKGEVDDNLTISYQRLGDDSSLENIKTTSLIGNSKIRGCSLLFNRHVLKQESLPSLSSGLGHDWWIVIIASIKGRALFYNKKLFKYRVHTQQTSRGVGFNASTAINIAKKRLAAWQEESIALQNLLLQKSLDKQTTVSIEKRAWFLSLRIGLVKDLRFSNLARLLVRLREYDAESFRVTLGVVRRFCGDIVCLLIMCYLRVKKNAY